MTVKDVCVSTNGFVKLQFIKSNVKFVSEKLGSRHRDLGPFGDHKVLRITPEDDCIILTLEEKA